MKTLKNLFLSLLLVPMIFMFTACGGQLDAKASCNTSGDWKQSEAATTAYTSAINGTTAINADAYRFTMEAKMKEGDKTEEFFVNAIMSKTEMAIKASIPKDDGKGNNTSYIYMKDNKLYMQGKDTDGKDVKYYMEGISLGDYLGTLTPGEGLSLGDDFDIVGSIIEMIKSLGNPEGVKIYQSGNNFRIEINGSALVAALKTMIPAGESPNAAANEPSTSNEEASLTAAANVNPFAEVEAILSSLKFNIYFNFTNDKKLTAFSFVAETKDSSFSLTVSAFDGKIEFPDFSSYKKLGA